MKILHCVEGSSGRTGVSGFIEGQEGLRAVQSHYLLKARAPGPLLTTGPEGRQTE